MLRFFGRQNDTPDLRGRDHLLRLPRYGDFKQSHRLRAESRDFLQPWEPLVAVRRIDEATFRVRVMRSNQEFSSSSSVSLLIFAADETLLGGVTIGYIRQSW